MKRQHASTDHLSFTLMLAKRRSLWFDLDDDSQTQNHEGWWLEHREATN